MKALKFKYFLVKNLMLVVLVLFSNAANSSSEYINTKYGVFSFSSEKTVGIQKLQTYKLNDIVLGQSEWIHVAANSVGSVMGNNQSETIDIISLIGSTGGSGCAEVVSIVFISPEETIFSPPLNACGGVTKIEIKHGVVVVNAFERDEKTKVSYELISIPPKIRMMVTKNNKHDFKSNFSFLNKQ